MMPALLPRLVPTFPVRLAVLAAAACVAAGCDVRIGPGYPERIVTPEITGPVASIASLPDGDADVRLASGEVIRIEADDRSLGGLGDFLFAGRAPEPWHLAGHKSQQGQCYWFSASRAWAEPDSVVVAFGDWPGTGIRLDKAVGFDDTTLTTRDSDGRRVFSGVGSVTFCTDDEGRISGLGATGEGRTAP